MLDFISDVEVLIQNNPQEAVRRCEQFFNQQKALKKNSIVIKEAALQQQLRIFRVLATVMYECTSRRTSKLFLETYEAMFWQCAPKGSLCNNLALSFISLEAEHYLKLQSDEVCSNSPLSNVQKCLEQALAYLKPDIECDLMLLTLQLSNLAVVLLHEKKFEQAVKTLLPIISLLQIEMKLEKRSDLSEKIVIVINCYYLLAISLKQHLRTSQNKLNEGLRTEYNENIDNFHERGLQLTLKHLGKKSIFIQLFKKLGGERPLTDRLPMVIKLPPKDTKAEEEKLIKQLESAVNTCIDEKFEEIQGLLMSKTNDRVPPGTRLLYETITNVDSNRTVITRLYQSPKGQVYGKVKLYLEKKGITVHRMEISEEETLAMENDPTRSMSLPFDVKFESCSPYEFLEFFVIPYVRVTAGNKLELSSMPIGLLDEMEVTFLGERAKMIVMHIKQCIYRICLRAEKSGYMMIVLQIGNSQSTEQVIVEVANPGETARASTDPEVCEVENMKNYLSGNTEAITNTRSFVRLKRLVNPGEFRTAAIAAVEQLSTFITNTFSPKHTNDELFASGRFMFKFYLENFGKPEGSMWALRFEPSMGWEIAIRNNYQTVGPTAPVYANGVSHYSLADFEEDFGLKYSQVKNKHERLKIFDLLLRMFALKTYSQPLNEIEANLYNSNAVTRRKLIKRIFRRTYLRRQFYIPLTACLIGMDGEEPMGVRLTYYSVGQNIERGAFLTIDSERWRMHKNSGLVSSKIPAEKLKRLDRFKYKTQYDMVSQFNLADILLNGGFDILLENFQEDEGEDNNFSVRTGTSHVKWERLQSMLTLAKLKKRIEQAI